MLLSSSNSVFKVVFRRFPEYDRGVEPAQQSFLVTVAQFYNLFSMESQLLCLWVIALTVLSLLLFSDLSLFYLPLLPGLWIMLLATLLFETALDLRRPFVA